MNIILYDSMIREASPLFPQKSPGAKLQTDVVLAKTKICDALIAKVLVQPLFLSI